MGITKNSIDFGSGFNIKSQGPIDSRMVVEKINDLTTVWDKDVPAYIGMVVYVKETGDIYVLTGGENVININEHAKDINNWKKQITDLPNMEDYVKTEDLSDYAKTEDIPSLDGYAKTEDIPSLDGYVKTEDIPSLDGYVKTEDLSDYVTDGELNTALSSKQDTLTAGTNISIDESNVISIDLSNYYTISQIDDLIKGIEDLIGDVNSLMGEILGS